MLGKLFHYAADAILISAVLAGIKRSTGLTVASNKIESKDVRSAVDQYLSIGEWVVDQGIMFMSSSKYFHKKRMDSDDQHNNSNNDMNELPSIQERRRQLEAYQAERALNKSLLRASVRPVDHPSRPSQLLNHSFAGFRASTRKSISVKEVPQSKEVVQDGGANQQQQHQNQSSQSTKSIIQHYNSLSKSNKLASALLGVRRYGTVAHRVEKKPIPTRPGMSSAHNCNQRDNDGAVSTLSIGISLSSFDADHTKESQNTKENMASSLWSSKTPALKAADTFGTKSVRLDRTTALSSVKKQEEIYLSQARLMQWYFMNRRAAEHFAAQEKSAETQFELVGRSLLEKQTKLQNLQKRFEVEQDLAELESTLGCQRDQLLAIIEGLDTFKADYEEFTAALDREARVLNIPGIDGSNLDQWLGQIMDCQNVLDTSSRRSSKDYELVQAIAQVMQDLCSIVMEEIQEMRQCVALAAKLREAETIEASLLASSLQY